MAVWCENNLESVKAYLQFTYFLPNVVREVESGVYELEDSGELVLYEQRLTSMGFVNVSGQEEWREYHYWNKVRFSYPASPAWIYPRMSFSFPAHMAFSDNPLMPLVWQSVLNGRMEVTALLKEPDLFRSLECVDKGRLLFQKTDLTTIELPPNNVIFVQPIDPIVGGVIDIPFSRNRSNNLMRHNAGEEACIVCGTPIRSKDVPYVRVWYGTQIVSQRQARILEVAVPGGDCGYHPIGMGCIYANDDLRDFMRRHYALQVGSKEE